MSLDDIDGMNDGGLAIVTQNLLLDDIEELSGHEPWRHTSTAIGATVVAVVCLGLLGWQHLAPTQPGPEPSRTIVAEHTYTIQQTTQLGDLTLIVGYIAEFARRGPLYLFTINPGEQPRPGNVTLDDGDGHQVNVISSDGPVPGASIRVQTIDVGKKFNKQKTRVRLHSGSTIRANLQ